jgi:ABC-type Fe3+-hydroxamate transport system substrate-binding protein
MNAATKHKVRWAALGLAVAGCAASAALLAGGGDDAPRVSREAAAAEGYEVTLAPVGTVRFARVPTTAMTVDANYNDMLVALGQGGRLAATGYEGNFYDGFYAQLPGVRVAVDPGRLKFLPMQSLDKEALYALGAGVHHVDPVQLLNGSRWKRNDIDEIARNVGPFFANRYSRENSHPGGGEYRYYTAWELAEKMGEVYRVPGRAAALKAVWDEMVRDIEARLPPEAERPRVGLVMYARGRFTPFSLSRQGFGTAHYRAVGARDAFAEVRDLTYADGGAPTGIDVEGLLKIDPDVLIMPFAVYASYRPRFEELRGLGADPLAGRLRAFRDGRVYPGGTPLQGPVFLLFQTEMAAKQIYPDRFGPFREDHAYPPGERLFDRERVARILSGGGAG